eukprot:6185863-Pleurochrysis_carterae.AAC.1
MDIGRRQARQQIRSGSELDCENMPERVLLTMLGRRKHLNNKCVYDPHPIGLPHWISEDGNGSHGPGSIAPHCVVLSSLFAAGAGTVAALFPCTRGEARGGAGRRGEARAVAPGTRAWSSRARPRPRK